MATMSASLPGASTPRSLRPRSSAATLVAAFKARSGTQPRLDHCLEFQDAVAERKHAAISAVGDLYMASGQQPLGRKDPLVVAPKLPHRLARQGAGLQFVQVLLGHLHRRNDIGSGPLRHLDPLGVDQIGMFEAARASSGWPACIRRRRPCERPQACRADGRSMSALPSRRRTTSPAPDRRRR